MSSSYEDLNTDTYLISNKLLYFSENTKYSDRFVGRVFKIVSKIDFKNTNLTLSQQNYILILFNIIETKNQYQDVILSKINSLLDSITSQIKVWSELLQQGKNNFGINFLKNSLKIDLLNQNSSIYEKYISFVETICNQIYSDGLLASSYSGSYFVLKSLFQVIVESYELYSENFNVSIWRGKSYILRLFAVIESLIKYCNPFNLVEASLLSYNALYLGNLLANQIVINDEEQENGQTVSPKSQSINSTLILKLFDCASSILSCKHKQEEFYLNKMAIISLCNCSKLSESYLSSTFQVGINQIVYQLQSINIFKDIIHMSYSNNVDAFNETLSNMTNIYQQSGKVNEQDNIELVNSHLSNNLKSINEIVESFISLIDFYQSDPSLEVYKKSIILVCSKACLHLIMSNKIMNKDNYEKDINNLNIEAHSMVSGSVLLSEAALTDSEYISRTDNDNMSNNRIYSISEVDDFINIIFSLFSKEMEETNLSDSYCLKFITLCLEICHQTSLYELKASRNPSMESQLQFYEASSLGIINLLGVAACKIVSNSLKIIIYEGLMSMLNYKLSCNFVTAVSKQLVNICSLIYTETERSNVSNFKSYFEAISSSQNSLLILFLDVTFTNFEREFNVLYDTLNEPKKSDSLVDFNSDLIFYLTEYLTGLSCGLILSIRLLFERLDLSSLKSFKIRIIDLFMTLILKLYSVNGKDKVVAVENKRIELVESVGLLIYPISIALEFESILKFKLYGQNIILKGEVDTSIANNNILIESNKMRHLWYFMVLFRLKESYHWQDFTNWLKSYQRIASFTPSLTYFKPAGASINSNGFIEKEISNDLVLSDVIKNLNKIDVVNINKYAKFTVKGLDISSLYYLINIQFCESLRCGGCLDFRFTLSYINNEILVYSKFIGRIKEISKYIYSIWIEAAVARNSDAISNESIDIAVEFDENNMNVLLSNYYSICDLAVLTSKRIHFLIEKIFQYILVNCFSNNDCIRELCVVFVKDICDRLISIKKSKSSIFFLLDSINELEVIFNNNFNVDNIGRFIQNRESRNLNIVSFWFEKYSESNHKYVGLPLTDMPNNTTSIAKAALEALQLAYWWFTSLSNSSHKIDASTVLQEYLLANDGRNTLAVSLANELKYLNVPTYHQFSDNYSTFRNERIKASTTILKHLNDEDKKISIKICNDNSEEKQTKLFNYKSLFVNEIKARTIGDSDLVKIANDLKTFMDKRKKENENIALTELVEYIWKIGATIHVTNHSYNLSSKNMNNLSENLLDLLSDLIYNIEGNERCDLVDNITEVWKWLLASFPILTLRIISSSLNTARSFICRSIQLLDSNKGGNITDSDWVLLVWDKLISYFNLIFVSYQEGFHLLMNSIELILSNLTEVINLNILKFLSLGFRLIDKTYSKLGEISIVRRRIIRERLILLTIQCFESDAVRKSISNDKLIDNFIILSELLHDINADTKYWDIDYAVSSIHNDNDAKINDSEEKFGPYAASNELLNNIIKSKSRYKKYVQLDTTAADFYPYVYDDNFSFIKTYIRQQRGLGINSNIYNSKKDSVKKMNNNKHIDNLTNAGIYLLLQMLILYEINSININKSDKNIPRGVVKDYKLLVNDFKVISKIENYKKLIKVVWAISPSLAIIFREKYSSLSVVDGAKKGVSHINIFISIKPHASRSSWYIASNLLEIIISESIIKKDSYMKELLFTKPAPVYVIIELLSRCSALSKEKKNPVNYLCMIPNVVRYAIRSLNYHLLHHNEIVIFYLPQLIQLLRCDIFNSIGSFLLCLCNKSNTSCHYIIWLLQTEVKKTNKVTSSNSSYGLCNSLTGVDPLPSIAASLIEKIYESLSYDSLMYLKTEIDFLNYVTNISAVLKNVKNKEARLDTIKEMLKDIDIPVGLYLPTNPFRLIVDVNIEKISLMQSAAKHPFLLEFKTIDWRGPNTFLLDQKSEEQLTLSPDLVDLYIDDGNIAETVKYESSTKSITTRVIPKSSSKSKKGGAIFSSPRKTSDFTPLSAIIGESDYKDVAVKERSYSEDSYAFNEIDVSNVNRNNDISHKNDSNRKITVDKTGNKEIKFQKLYRSRIFNKDDQSNEAENNEKDKIEFDTLASNITIHSDSLIFKVFDDCRQDVLIIQITKLLDLHFKNIGLPIYFVPYNVISSRTGDNNNIGAIIEVVPNVKSRDQLGKNGAKNLLQHYINSFGNIHSYGFKQAQLNFIHSLAGYSVLCYLCHIKDRHNGNILIDNIGRIIHIDYGFIFGISPGNNLGFESAAFKLSKEYVQLMGGKGSEIYNKFINLTIEAFLSARTIMNEILSLISCFADSDLICFKYKDTILIDIRDKFFPNLTSVEAGRKFKKLILSSENNWTTVGYEGVQKLQNNIYSEEWK